MGVLSIESTTAEKLPVLITTSADPTGSLPEFALTTSGDPSTWVDGEWDGAWSSTTGKIQALTPLVGDGQALDVTDGVDYDLWARWVVGTETPVRHVNRLRVT
jgi:hypothetical protein